MIEAAHSDQRRHRRYAIKGEIFIGSWPIFHVAGKLKDISEGGVGFEYIGTGNHDQRRTLEVDIVCGKHFRLSRLSCKVAYDIRADRSSTDNIGTRRCGLMFGRLSHQQASLLSLILSSYA
jgi:hypothetical protein